MGRSGPKAKPGVWRRLAGAWAKIADRAAAKDKTTAAKKEAAKKEAAEKKAAKEEAATKKAARKAAEFEAADVEAAMKKIKKDGGSVSVDALEKAARCKRLRRDAAAAREKALKAQTAADALFAAATAAEDLAAEAEQGGARKRAAPMPPDPSRAKVAKTSRKDNEKVIMLENNPFAVLRPKEDGRLGQLKKENANLKKENEELKRKLQGLERKVSSPCVTCATRNASAKMATATSQALASSGR